MPSRRKTHSRSRARSRSRRQPESDPVHERIYATFVIPLAGVLSSIAARIYDMGAASSKPRKGERGNGSGSGSGNANGTTNGSERTPLLPHAESGVEGEESRTRRLKRWFAINAVAVFMTLLITAVIIILCVFFGVYRSSKRPSTRSTLCTTPACVHAASEILYNLSPDYQSLDACTDFEQLVCEGWDSRHDLRPDQGDAFTGTIMSENSQMLLRHILEAPYPEESEHSSFSPAQLLESLSSIDQDNFNKLKGAYDACMDEDAVKKKGVKPLHEILQQVTDMFPVEESALPRKTALESKDEEDLADTILYLSKIGVPSVISCGAGADDKDPDVVVVQCGPPYSIGLPAKDYYSDAGVVEKYEDTVAQILENLYPDRSNTTLLARWTENNRHAAAASGKSFDVAHDVIEFEKKLAAASPDAEDRDDVTQYYNPMSLKDADKLTPQIQLSSLINGLSPSDVKTDRLIVMSPSYMKNLSSILSSTSKETLQTYLVWKVVQAYASVIEADELKPYSRFSNELQGKDPDSTSERWRKCVRHVDSGLGWILSRFFVEKAFSEKAKIFGDQIVSDIKGTFIQKLLKTTWMDESVVELAIQKVHKIVQKIGYPTKASLAALSGIRPLTLAQSPDIMDPPSLRQYYSSVKISPTAFFANALAINRFDVAREWSSLGKPVDRDEWGMSVPTVNAYYNPPGNEIVFPAGIMQFPVFDVSVPPYLSYGAFGSVSGHELSHAFDSTGRHYDQNGNYTDWWTPSTVTNFKERAECFVEQYHNYTVPGPDDKPLHVNGKLTLGENIADAGGVSAAFAAWKMRRAEMDNADLPGLQYFTQEQLFFVSYANWWCGKSRKETAISRIYTDPHAPKWARILGTMANSRDFKEAFGCEATEPICELW